jgi:hypothetical protein
MPRQSTAERRLASLNPTERVYLGQLYADLPAWLDRASRSELLRVKRNAAEWSARLVAHLNGKLRDQGKVSSRRQQAIAALRPWAVPYLRALLGARWSETLGHADAASFDQAVRLAYAARRGW